MNKELVTLQGNTYYLVSDYKDNQNIRESFFKLAKKSFGVNFKEWYEAGYWGNGYRPYSMANEDGQVIANVSVSLMEFVLKGEVKHWIQLGCVVVEKAYRKEGLARFLLEYVISIYEKDNYDIYLFANDSVLDFYPRFGFKRIKEYEWYQSAQKAKEESVSYEVKKLESANLADIRLVLEKTKGYYKGQQLAVCNNTNLMMFYWQDYFADAFYYIEELDTLVVAKYERQILYIYEVFGEADLKKIVSALIQEEVKRVVLGFTPEEKSEYKMRIYQKEDTTLFVYNKEIKELFEKHKLMFPILSYT